MRVLIADDEVRVRSALKLLLEQGPDISLAGEVDRIGAMLERVACNRPDVILLDWELPGDDRATMVQEIRRLSPGTAIIVLSGSPDSKTEARRAGIRYFVCKNDPPETLLSVLQSTTNNLEKL